ncbi:hypothetical protein N431DRAFT_434641 [Stipitochalara longipes BDJ]|nr:hypothetical protein N431DRAFT_434641 [Stipitochalara longipes BDJ]
MKFTTSLVAAAALLTTALGAPTTISARDAQLTWTITDFTISNNTDNLSSKYNFNIVDNTGSSTPCYIANAYPTGTSLDARCAAPGDNGPTGNSTNPYSISWYYDKYSDQAIMEVFTYLQAAVFLYPRASNMLQGGVTEDDVGPNAARWLPVG